MIIMFYCSIIAGHTNGINATVLFFITGIYGRGLDWAESR